VKLICLLKQDLGRTIIQNPSRCRSYLDLLDQHFQSYYLFGEQAVIVDLVCLYYAELIVWSLSFGR